MKKILFVLPFLIFFVACESMDDIYKPFIENGEIIYSVKVDSVLAFPGRNRIKIQAGFATAPHVKKVRITWDDGESEQEWDVAGSNDSMYYDFMIDNLEERSYVFEVYSLDADGNRSIKTDLFSTVYGEKYEATLKNRPIQVLTLTEDSMIISWGNPPEHNYLSEVTVKKADGNDSVVVAQRDEFQTVVKGVDYNSELSYVSGYLPADSLTIDTFYCAADNIDLSVIPLKINKAAWVVDSVDNACCYPAENLIDEDPYSEWIAYPGSYPHWAVIDMKKQVNIAQIEVSHSPNGPGWGGALKKIQFELSSDGVTWETVGPFDFPSGQNTPQFFEIELDHPVQHIRFEALEGTAGWGVAVGDLSVYGTLN